PARKSRWSLIEAVRRGRFCGRGAKEAWMLLASSVAVTHRALATVDLVIIGVYFAIVFGIGMYLLGRNALLRITSWQAATLDGSSLAHRCSSRISPRNTSSAFPVRALHRGWQSATSSGWHA